MFLLFVSENKRKSTAVFHNAKNSCVLFNGCTFHVITNFTLTLLWGKKIKTVKCIC